jgi:CheY-like chemotaxis protein/two-component sensor histidine kinase
LEELPADRAQDRRLSLGAIYLLAHELMDPLTAVNSSAEMLAGHDLPAPLARLAEVIRRRSRYCQAISMILLDRDVSGQRAAESFPVAPVLELVAQLGADLAREGQSVRVRSDPGLLACGDPVLLECALSNLVRNALQAGGADCRVEVSASSGRDRVNIEVTDNGPGVPEDILDSLFRRGVSTKPAGRGTGLGLWLSRSMLEAYGGKLELASTGSTGSSFRIWLPPGAPPRAAGSVGEQVPAAGSDQGPPGLRVLVVEDDPDVSALIAEALELFGNRPARARTIDEARSHLEAGDVDAVTLDLGLGAASGLELYAEMTERWPGLARRVVLCSAAPLDLVEALPPGLSPELLRKPFRIDDLIAAVRKAAATR